MKKLILLVVGASLAMAGCGGLTLGLGVGEISGNIVDIDGNPVRGAIVGMDNRETESNSSGAYVLTNIREGIRTIRAEVTVDGIEFSGETTAQIFNGDRTRSVNIHVSRSSTQARVSGIVRDRFGVPLQGAHVFAYLDNSSGFTLSSIVEVTDSQGRYEIRSLAPGFTYILNASGRGYDSDRISISPSANQSLTRDLVLDDPSDPLFGPPQNLVAVAWTSPDEGAGRGQTAEAYEAIKRIVDPRRARASGLQRTTFLGYNVEVDLYWDAPVSNLNSLLGYGIYRATSSSGASVAVDFLRDPEVAFYADIDDFLIENSNYYYEITALNVNYPDTSNSESNFSNRYGVRTLEEMLLNSPILSPLTFRWQSVVDATSYTVYLFDEYPALGSNPIWFATTSNLQQVYSGPALVSGERYYYVVLGTANSDDSRTISVIGDFVAN